MSRFSRDAKILASVETSDGRQGSGSSYGSHSNLVESQLVRQRLVTMAETVLGTNRGSVTHIGAGVGSRVHIGTEAGGKVWIGQNDCTSKGSLLVKNSSDASVEEIKTDPTSRFQYLRIEEGKARLLSDRKRGVEEFRGSKLILRSDFDVHVKNEWISIDGWSCEHCVYLQRGGDEDGREYVDLSSRLGQILPSDRRDIEIATDGMYLISLNLHWDCRGDTVAGYRSIRLVERGVVADDLVRVHSIHTIQPPTDRNLTPFTQSLVTTAFLKSDARLYVEIYQSDSRRFGRCPSAGPGITSKISELSEVSITLL